MAWYFLLPSQDYQPGTVVTVATVLDRDPEVISGRQVIRLGGLVVFAPVVPELHFGDKVVVKGTVVCGQLGKDCSRLLISKPIVEYLGEASVNSWQRFAFTVRTRYIEIYQTLLDREQTNLLSGVVLGGVGLDRQFKDRLAKVGLTHVVAASGMNISLFSGFVLWLLALLKIGRIYKFTITVILILFYCTITGFEAPIVRAAVMVSFSIIGFMLGRQYMSLVGLALAAYLMLWVSPNLIVSVSFLLSFSAMIGQIVLGSSSGQVLGKRNFMADIISFLAKDFRQSTAAVLTTFPIVLVFFAKFSLISIFTNALVLWTVEPLMILGGTAGIAGVISIELAKLVILPATVLLDFFLWVVDFFSREEFLLKLNVSWFFVIGYYFLLAGAVWWWKVHSWRDRIVQ